MSVNNLKIVCLLQIITAVLGIVVGAGILLSPLFQEQATIFHWLVLLIPIPYIIGTVLLWQKKKSGLVISFILNLLALIDITTDNFSFYLTNGFQFNIENSGIGLDLWTLIILSFLIATARDNSLFGKNIVALKTE